MAGRGRTGTKVQCVRQRCAGCEVSSRTSVSSRASVARVPRRELLEPRNSAPAWCQRELGNIERMDSGGNLDGTDSERWVQFAASTSTRTTATPSPVTPLKARRRIACWFTLRATSRQPWSSAVCVRVSVADAGRARGLHGQFSPSGVVARTAVRKMGRPGNGQGLR